MDEANYLYNKYLLEPGERPLTPGEYETLAKRLKREREKREKNKFLEFPVTFKECFE